MEKLTHSQAASEQSKIKLPGAGGDDTVHLQVDKAQKGQNTPKCTKL